MATFTDAFLRSFTTATEMDRQKKQDRERAVQQAVDNALREHAQEQEDRRLSAEAELHRQEAEHWKALENQAREANRIRDADEARKAQKDALTDAEAKERARNTRLGLRQKALKSGSTQAGAMEEAGFTDEEMTQALARIVSQRTPQVQQQNQQAAQGNMQFMGPILGQMAAGITGVPVGIPSGGQIQPLQSAPTTESVGAEQSPEFLGNQKAKEALTKLRMAQAEMWKESQAATIALKTAQESLVKAETSLKDEERKYVSKNYNFKVAEFNQKRFFEGKEIDLRYSELAIQKARLRIEQGKDERAFAAGMEDFLNDQLKPELSHLEKLQTEERSLRDDIHQAQSRMDVLNDHVKAVGGFTQADPQVQQTLWSDEATRRAARITLGQVTAAREATQKRIGELRRQILSAKSLNTVKVTQSGGIRPILPDDLKPSSVQRDTRFPAERGRARKKPDVTGDGWTATKK